MSDLPDPSRQTVQPVILSGGSGTRLWPVSRKTYPKQFLRLLGDHSLLGETVLRVARSVPDDWTVTPPMIVANETHKSLVMTALGKAGQPSGRLILEPVARNTAPAIALAARLCLLDGDDPLLLVLPSDHVISLEDRFGRALTIAAAAAAKGRLVTFGIEPDRAETGYGYVRAGTALADIDGAFAIDRFVEKPSNEQAAVMLAQGGWSWNSGMFLFGAGALWTEIERWAPEIAAAVDAAVAGGRTEGRDFHPMPSAFAAAPSLPIDVAVMERTQMGAVVPASLGWNDIGSWRALLQLAPKDASGTARFGDVLALDSDTCYVRGDGIAVAAVGVSNLAIVATPDAVLVCDMNNINTVKEIAQQYSDKERDEAKYPSLAEEVWGWVRTLDRQDGRVIHKISINPGETANRSGLVDQLIVYGGVGTIAVDGADAVPTFDAMTLTADGYRATAGENGLDLIEIRCGSAGAS